MLLQLLFSVFYPSQRNLPTHTVELTYIGVALDVEGKGIGSVFFNAFTEASRSSEYRSVELTTKQGGSIRWPYIKNLGLTMKRTFREGRFKRYRMERNIVIMKRCLKKVEALFFSERSIPFLLFIVAVLALDCLSRSAVFIWIKTRGHGLFSSGPRIRNKNVFHQPASPGNDLSADITDSQYGSVALAGAGRDLRWLTALLVWAVLRQGTPASIATVGSMTMK